MSPTLRARMVGCNDAHQIWKSIHTYFESQTHAKVSRLKTQLKGIRKIDSLNNYLLSIKKIVDTHDSVGSPIDPSEHISIILDGLSSEYNSLVTSIISCTDPYTVTEIKTLLATLESRLERQKKEESDSFAMQSLQENMAQFQNRFGKNQEFRIYSKNPQNFRGGSNLRYRDKGFGRNNGRGYNKVQCQVCQKPGHTTLQCYHRFNPSFQHDNPTFQQQSHYLESQNKVMNIKANLDDHVNVSTLMVVPKTLYNPSWYLDTRETNHVTPNASNLMGKISYKGEAKLKMANGESSSIQ
uniref:Retrovirus-related Pol polyprotein from transposon TNT 1-94 n=1 Tax=Cajanus cajan TaxID=3821 RepID=A0A151SMB9_CAJCA|nr:hypothetical protein KK1_002125 [Cajanus cajan]